MSKRFAGLLYGMNQRSVSVHRNYYGYNMSGGEMLMSMKKMITWMLIGLMLIPAFSCCSAETCGFGIINNTDVALRKTPGGQKLIRLPKDICVWIKDEKTDNKGSLWYEVNLGYYDEGSYRNCSGWIKAEFIEAGDKLWHDVRSVKAGQYGMMALKKDGTVECVCDMNNQQLRGWAAGLRDIRQVSLTWLGWGFYALDGSGTFRDPDGNTLRDIRLACEYGYPFLITKDNRLLTGGINGFTWVWPQDVSEEELSHIITMTNTDYRLILLTDDGRVFAARSANDNVFYPEPEWDQWMDVISIDAGISTFTGGGPYQYTFTAVRKDGTVLAAPDRLSDMLSSWRNIQKICIGYQWIIGLKNDGTIIVLAPGGTNTPDVSDWAGITDIGNGGDYIVGVKADGTLIFAGEHSFSD